MMNMPLLMNWLNLNTMCKLNKLDKLLIRWGIVTKNYKRYAYRMQRALDEQHLSYSDFIDKYYGNS